MGGFANPSALIGLSPSANIGGSSAGVPAPGGSPSSAGLGGTTNPFLSVFPNGQNMPGASNPFSNPSGASASAPTATNTGGFPANMGGATAAPAVPGSPNVGQSNILDQLNTISGPATQLPGSGHGGTNTLKGIVKGLAQAGVPKGLAYLLANFISSGSGYNPQVANALIAQMQPTIERGTESIAEQFSAEGGRFSSAAATGMGDFMSQVQLNEGQIFANLYEQSVQNYLSVLNGKMYQKHSGGGILGGIASFLGGGGGAAIGSIAEGLQGGGGITDVLSSLAGMLAA